MPSDLGNVVLSFFKRRDAAVFSDGRFPGVVSSDGAGIISVKEIDQVLEILNAAFDVLLRIEAGLSRRTVWRWKELAA